MTIEAKETFVQYLGREVKMDVAAELILGYDLSHCHPTLPSRIGGPFYNALNGILSNPADRRFPVVNHAVRQPGSKRGPMKFWLFDDILRHEESLRREVRDLVRLSNPDLFIRKMREEGERIEAAKAAAAPPAPEPTQPALPVAGNGKAGKTPAQIAHDLSAGAYRNLEEISDYLFDIRELLGTMLRVWDKDAAGKLHAKIEMRDNERRERRNRRRSEENAT